MKGGSEFTRIKRWTRIKMKKIIALIVCAAAAIFFSAPQSGAETADKLEFDANLTAFTSPIVEAYLPYGYSDLSEQAQKCYIDIRRAVVTRKNSVKVSSRISGKTLNEISGILHGQDPLMLGSFSIEFCGVNTDNAYAKFTYTDSEPMPEGAVRDTVKQADNIVSSISADADEAGRLKEIMDYIAENTEYKSTDSELGRSAYGPLVNGESDSKGYAYAMKLVCAKAGINCAIIYGTDEQGNEHVWNKVRINGSWYNVDCAQFDAEGGGYFLIDDETMGKNFTQDTLFDYPAAGAQ